MALKGPAGRYALAIQDPVFESFVGYRKRRTFQNETF
jgi:hypothetical protein